MRIRLFLLVLFLPPVLSLFLHSASGQSAPATIQVSSLPGSCTNGTQYQVNSSRIYFCTNGIPVPLAPGATSIDPIDYGVQANWKEFWASTTTISVSTSSTTITCTGCFNSATDVGKETVGSSNCTGDVACGLFGLPLFPAGTTISSVTNSNTAVVSNTPINSGSTNAYIAFGTNDDAAWTAVSTAAANLNTCATVFFPAGMSNWDTVGKFNSAPPGCTAVSTSNGKQTNVALAQNTSMAYIGYGPATSRILLTPAFASSMHSPGCNKACTFTAASITVENIGFWGAGNSVACYDSASCSAGTAPCSTSLNGNGTCTILGAFQGAYYHNVSGSGFGGAANNTKLMLGLGGALIDGGGVFAYYNNVRMDGLGNFGVTGQNSTAINSLMLDNFLGNFQCNGQCYNYSVGYGNGATTGTINAQAALYTCAVGPCYSTKDYQAYTQITSTSYQAFQITAFPNGNLFIDGFLNTPYGTTIPAKENGVYCNNVTQCQVHVRNSQLQGGASGNIFVSFGSNTGDVIFDEGGNIFNGTSSWVGSYVPLGGGSMAAQVTTASTNFGTAISSTALVSNVVFTAPMNVYVSTRQVTAGVGCGAGTNTAQVTISYTAPGGTAEGPTVTSLSISANGSVDSGVTASQIVSFTPRAGTAVNYSVTSMLASAGCTTTPQYTIDLRVQ